MALTRNRLIGNLANATDSAASSSFLAKGATEANYQSIAYSDVTGKPTILDSAGITSIIDSAYVLARQGSAVAGLDSAGITSLIDSNYVVARAAASGSGYDRYNYTATAGQTVFQDSDNSGALLSYTSGGIMVFYNGVMLKNTADWEGTDGSSVTLVEAADSGANVSIHKWTVAGGGAGGSSATWYGDRGVFAAGVYTGSSRTNVMDYIDITTAGNATDFGDTAGYWSHISGASDATYGVYIGSYASSGVSTDMWYITFSTPSNSTDFGDVSLNTYWPMLGNVSDGTYGLYAGGMDYTTNTIRNTIEYFTIATPANAADFGDMTLAKRIGGCFSDATYGVFGGGLDINGSSLNTIDYVTIASPGNATDFGDLNTANWRNAGASDDTRGLFTGGIDGGTYNTIEYVTIATPSNATDFGDLSDGRYQHGATSNSTRCVMGGGNLNSGGNNSNSIHYVTIQTTGNSSSFGSLTQGRTDLGALSGNAS